MKKFKCIASKSIEGKKNKTKTFKSVKFSVVATCFATALLAAEKKAKKIFVFESLKVSEL